MLDLPALNMNFANGELAYQADLVSIPGCIRITGGGVDWSAYPDRS